MQEVKQTTQNNGDNNCKANQGRNKHTEDDILEGTGVEA